MGGRCNLDQQQPALHAGVDAALRGASGSYFGERKALQRAPPVLATANEQAHRRPTLNSAAARSTYRHRSESRTDFDRNRVPTSPEYAGEIAKTREAHIDFCLDIAVLRRRRAFGFFHSARLLCDGGVGHTEPDATGQHRPNGIAHETSLIRVLRGFQTRSGRPIGRHGSLQGSCLEWARAGIAC
jgi:hypothetical protein